MSERNADPETPRWQPFGRPPATEPPKPEKLVEEMRTAAEAVLAALADDRPADALAYAGNAVEAAGALRDAVADRDRPERPAERLGRALFGGKGDTR